VTIHASDPFATPEDQRSPVRRLRGRLPAPVTLWTAGEGTGRAGLTVSSLLVVDGDPGRVLGLVDPESELWAAVGPSGRFAVVRLGPDERRLAEVFAGVLPAPGGRFTVGAWRDTGYGPVPEGDAVTWAGCVLDAARPYGWGLLVEATIAEISFGVADTALGYFRGRYQQIPS
jgi:3-hydroxy-9,10-secoandrosta-1,3,5(10)-triene-9,17-dione monooxygenase reductase component